MKNKLLCSIVVVFLLVSFRYSVYAQKTIQIDKKGALLRVKIEKTNAAHDLKKFLEKNKGFILDEANYDGVISLILEKGEVSVLAHKKGDTYTVIKSRNERYDPATGLRLKDFYTVTEKYESDVYTTEKVKRYYLKVVDANTRIILNEHLDLNSANSLDGFLYAKLKPLFPVKLSITLDSEDVLTYVEYAQEILAAGQNVNAGIGALGKTMLMAAVAQNKHDIVEFLVAKGADINVTDSNGQSAIFYALTNGNKKTLDYLKEKGARTNVVDKKGQSFAALERKFLIDFFVDAIQNNDYMFMQSLLAQKIAIDQPSSRGVYPFDEAVRNPNRRAFDMILSSGFNPGSGKGSNPEYSLLLTDLRYGNGEKVETLLQWGYRLFKGSKDNESAMDYALVNQKKDTVLLFMNYNGPSFITKNNHIFMFKTDQSEFYERLYTQSSFGIDDYALNQILTKLPRESIVRLIQTKKIASEKFFHDYIKYSKENPDPTIHKELLTNVMIIKKFAQGGMLMSGGMWEVVNSAFKEKNDALLAAIAQEPLLQEISMSPEYGSAYGLSQAQKSFRGSISFGEFIASTDRIDIMKIVVATVSKTVKKRTLLHYAVAENQIAMAQFLQKQGYSVDDEYDGKTPQSLAIHSNNQEMIKALNIVIVVTPKDEYYTALKKDDVEGLKQALAKGAVIDFYYNILTAINTKSFKVLQYIVEEGNLEFLKNKHYNDQIYTEHDIYLALAGMHGGDPAPVYIWEAAIKRGLKFEKSPEGYERNLLYTWLSALNYEKDVEVFKYVLSLGVDYTKKYGTEGSIEDRLKTKAKNKLSTGYMRYVRLYEALQAYKKKKK